MCLANFATKVINFLTQLFEEGNLKPWDDLKLEYSLTNETSFQWLQSKNAVPHKWHTKIKQSPDNVGKLLIQHHHLIKGVRILDHQLIKRVRILTLKKVFQRIIFNFGKKVY